MRASRALEQRQARWSKAPFTLKEFWAIRVRSQLAGRRRELALFNLAIDSKLRGCDLVKLRVRDVWPGDGVSHKRNAAENAATGSVRNYGTDTGGGGRLDRSWRLTSEDSLFPSRVRGSLHLSTRQYARIVDSWANQLGLDRASYGTQTLRRTKATLICRRTKNLRAVQLLLGHTKLESTVRYLGIEINDALEMAEQTEV
jgi:site-specific recombinase XerC